MELWNSLIRNMDLVWQNLETYSKVSITWGLGCGLVTCSWWRTRRGREKKVFEDHELVEW